MLHMDAAQLAQTLQGGNDVLFLDDHVEFFHGDDHKFLDAEKSMFGYWDIRLFREPEIGRLGYSENILSPMPNFSNSLFPNFLIPKSPKLAYTTANSKSRTSIFFFATLLTPTALAC